jgi:septal ring-binding cell division protein DamX
VAAASPPPQSTAAPVAAPGAAAPSSPAAIPVAATASAAPDAGRGAPPDAVASRVAAGRELLADGSSARYAVQLMVTDARERGYLESYLAEAGRALKSDKLFLVPSGSPESPRLGVLFGTFNDRNEAIAALDSLPPQLRQFKPYVRNIEAVREDARRTERR